MLAPREWLINDQVDRAYVHKETGGDHERRGHELMGMVCGSGGQVASIEEAVSGKKSVQDERLTHFAKSF